MNPESGERRPQSTVAGRADGLLARGRADFLDFAVLFFTWRIR
jgi:hypothetical protein